MTQAKVPTTIEKPKKISKKVAAAIELLVSGECKTQRAAAKRVDLNECHLSTELKRPHVLAHIEQRVRQQLAAGTIKAGSRILELIHAKSEHVSLDAATRVLALANIRPPDAAPQVSVDVNIRAGYVISLEERDEPALPIVGPQPPSPAKVIEHEPQKPAKED